MNNNQEIEFGNKYEDGLSRLTKAFRNFLTEYNEFKQITERIQSQSSSHYKPRFKQDKNSISVTVLRPDALAKKLTSLIAQLEKVFLLLINSNNNQPQNISRIDNGSFAIRDFVYKNNEAICEIIVYLGMVITSHSKPEILGSTGFNIDDQFKLYLKYSQMVTNLAEKSVIKYFKE